MEYQKEYQRIECERRLRPLPRPRAQIGIREIFLVYPFGITQNPPQSPQSMRDNTNHASDFATSTVNLLQNRPRARVSQHKTVKGARHRRSMEVVLGTSLTSYQSLCVSGARTRSPRHLGLIGMYAHLGKVGGGS